MTKTANGCRKCCNSRNDVESVGQLHTPDLTLLIAAVFSRHAEALAWAHRELEHLFGPVAFISLPYEFNQTRYYEPAMGTHLRKYLLAFHELAAADCLPDVKHRTNQLEQRLADMHTYAEPRPLNIDPGLLTLGKFLLATTKDQAHRIYLREGIFAEVTLRFHAGEFEPWTWTYADYRQPCVLDFLRQARDFYRVRLAERREADGP